MAQRHRRNCATVWSDSSAVRMDWLFISKARCVRIRPINSRVGSTFDPSTNRWRSRPKPSSDGVPVTGGPDALRALFGLTFDPEAETFYLMTTALNDWIAAEWLSKESRFSASIVVTLEDPAEDRTDDPGLHVDQLAVHGHRNVQAGGWVTRLEPSCQPP